MDLVRVMHVFFVTTTDEEVEHKHMVCCVAKVVDRDKPEEDHSSRVSTQVYLLQIEQQESNDHQVRVDVLESLPWSGEDDAVYYCSSCQCILGLEQHNESTIVALFLSAGKPERKVVKIEVPGEQAIRFLHPIEEPNTPTHLNVLIVTDTQAYRLRYAIEDECIHMYPYSLGPARAMDASKRFVVVLYHNACLALHDAQTHDIMCVQEPRMLGGFPRQDQEGNRHRVVIAEDETFVIADCDDPYLNLKCFKLPSLELHRAFTSWKRVWDLCGHVLVFMPNPWDTAADTDDEKKDERSIPWWHRALSLLRNMAQPRDPSTANHVLEVREVMVYRWDDTTSTTKATTVSKPSIRCPDKVVDVRVNPDCVYMYCPCYEDRYGGPKVWYGPLDVKEPTQCIVLPRHGFGDMGEDGDELIGMVKHNRSFFTVHDMHHCHVVFPDTKQTFASGRSFSRRCIWSPQLDFAVEYVKLLRQWIQFSIKTSHSIQLCEPGSSTPDLALCYTNEALYLHQLEHHRIRRFLLWRQWPPRGEDVYMRAIPVWDLWMIVGDYLVEQELNFC